MAGQFLGYARCGRAFMPQRDSDPRHSDQRSVGARPGHPLSGRELLWIVEPSFNGWACSQCEWNDPIPTLLNDPDAKTAYDRLAGSKFRQHKCEEHLARLPSHRGDSFTARIKKMITHGFKPKDAVELLVQEVSLESPNQPKVLAQAKAEGEDFLRRIRAGLI
jgi:hypothetical protein